MTVVFLVTFIMGSTLAKHSSVYYGATIYLKNAEGICNVPLVNFTTTFIQPLAPFDQLVWVTITSGSPCVQAYISTRP